VWVEHKKFIAAVAIHNQGEDKGTPKTHDSRGALLTADLLRDVFEWLDRKQQNDGVKLIRKSIQLQVRPPKPKKNLRPAAVHERGLFLSFMTRVGFGRVRLGSGTKFDWMPVQVDANRVVRYGLSTVDERKWLRFNLAASNVELREQLDKGECLLHSLKGKPEKTLIALGVETGEVRGDAPVFAELRMQATYIKLYDESRESSEVSFGEYPTPATSEQYNKFMLKDA